MTTYTLFPKLNHVGAEIHETQKECVLYKHMSDKTVEFNIFKSAGKFNFINSGFVFNPIPTEEDIQYLNQYNESQV